jgi:hypothetical protein
MKCKTCEIELEPPHYISCEGCDAVSCMTHGILMPEGFACSEPCAVIVKKRVEEWSA